MPRPTLRASAALSTLALLGACADSSPVAPSAAAPGAVAASMAALDCTVDLRAHTLGCAPAAATGSAAPSAAAGAPARTLVIGGAAGADTLVRLAATTPTVSGKDVTVPVTVQNLLPQPMGTADGVTYDGTGLQVFFQTPPTMRTGAAAGQPVTVSNPTGTGTFTASNQPYFGYAQLLTGNEVTPAQNWTFTLPAGADASADRFRFTVYVQARLADETTPVVMPAHAFDVRSVEGPAAGLAGGREHTCAIRPGAGVYCWGSNRSGQLGFGAVPSAAIAPRLIPGTRGIVQVTTGPTSSYTCALDGAGAAYCWGDNTYGQLGDGSTSRRDTPTAVAMPNGAVLTSLVTGYGHTCGLTRGGAAYCWGYNGYGQLGTGNFSGRLTPSAVSMPAGVTFTALSAGYFHTCALASDGAAYCWGYNGEGQAGDGTTASRYAPTRVAMPAGETFTSLAGGAFHTCGLTSAGAAYCWGRNFVGQLGDGTTTTALTPTAVAMPSGVGITAVTAGYSHTCALTGAGAAYCWGANNAGQLGDGTRTDRPTPAVVPVSARATPAVVIAGAVHTCALSNAGAAYCWGENAYGQVGDGTIGNRPSPVAVSMP